MVTILQKKRHKRALYSRPTILLLIILSIFLGKAVLNIYEKARSTRENLDLAQEELDSLKNRGELLDDKINSLVTPKGVEAEIRDKFNVVKEGENVVIIVNEPLNSEGTEGERDNSIWKRIWGFFNRN